MTAAALGLPGAVLAQILEPCDARTGVPRTFCGTVEVPEDHADPSSRTLSLAVVVVAAEGEPREDPIFLLSGGPGQAATDFAAFAGRGRSPEFRSRDIVLVDQRGTGASNPLSCPLAGTPAEHFSGILAPDRVLHACLVDLRRRAEPALYTTTQSAHDIEAVRRALLYGPVNLSGSSYGTRLALEYMRRYPESVRTAMITGVAPVDFASPLEYARFAQDALDRLFADCRSDPSCSEAYPRLEDAWSEVLARLRAAPAEVTLPEDLGGSRVTFDVNDFAYTVRTMLYGPQALRIPGLVYRAWRYDDVSTFAEAYARRAEALWPQLALGLHLSVFCAEDVPFIGTSDVSPATEGTYLATYAIDEYRRACGVWERGAIPDDFTSPVRADTPVLIVSGRRDPSTPPATGERVALDLPNAVHLVHPWGGHGFAGTSQTECEAIARETLLAVGSTRDIDVTCAQHESPIPFEIVSPGDRAAALAAERARIETPVITELDVHPDGTQIAYVQVDLAGEVPTSRVFLTGLDSWPGRPIGSGRMPRFRPGGAGVTLLSPGSEGPEVHVVVEGDERPRRIVRAPGGVLDYAWSPGGDRIVFAAPDPNGRTQLWVHDTRSGESTQATRVDGTVHTEAFGGGGAFDWSPDGSRIAFAVQRDRSVEGAYGSDVHVLDLETGTVRHLVDRPGVDFRPRWSPDGRRIAFATSFGAMSRFARHGLAVANVGSGVVRDVGHVDATFLEAPSTHLWTRDGSSLVVARPRGISTALVRIDLEGSLERLWTDRHETVAMPRYAPDADRIVLLASDPASPWAVRSFDLVTGVERRIGGAGHPPTHLLGERTSWTNAEGVRLSGVLYRPSRDGATGPRPLVTWLHGGPDGRTAAAFDPSVPFPTASFDPLPLHALIAMGYAVFLPNHRGSAGEPGALRTTVAGRYPQVLEEDVLSGIDSLVERRIADPDRLVLGGWASGGLAAIQLLTRTARFRAAISGGANTSLEAAYGDGDFPLQWHSLMGGPPWTERAAWDAASPIRQAGRIRTPLLLLHGADDALVPVDQSRWLHTYLTGQGGTARLDVLEEVGHGVVLPAHRLDVAARILDWVEGWARD